MKNKAILYYDPQRLEAVILGEERLNFPMFRRNLKIYRGVDNVIEFELKDSNRMPVAMRDRDFKCIITNPYNRDLMLVRHMVAKDSANGIFELKMTPGDVQKWSAGFYTFCVMMQNLDGTEELFYTTLDQDVTGTFELIDKPFPEFVPSHLIRSEDFTMVEFNNLAALNGQTTNTPNPVTIDFISSRFAGCAQKNLSSGMQTFSMLLNNFTGKFYVQGSLEDNPTTESAWFNISVDPIANSDSQSFVNATGIDVFNFEGNYNWIRFKYRIWILNYGSIEKIWLKV